MKQTTNSVAFTKPSIMKKWGLICVIVVIITMLFALSGCSAKVKSESEIASDLFASPDFYSTQNVTISDIEIIKRQTDKKEKTDIVYVNVKAQNENIKCNISYQLYYCLYNEGWMLDGVYRYDTENWEITPLTGPTEELVKEEASLAFAGWSYELLDSNLDLVNKTSIFNFHTIKDYKYAKRHTVYAMNFIFDERSTKWVWDGVDMVGDAKMEWDLSGNWSSSRGSSFPMTITKVNNETIHIVMRSVNTGKKIIDDDVSLSVEGAEVEFIVGSTAITVHIEPRSVHVVFEDASRFIYEDYTYTKE